MGAGYHGGFGATKGSRASNDAAPGTVKLVKHGQGEKFGEYATRAKPKDGYTDVIIHGNPETDKVSVYHNGEWVDIDQRRLSNYVKQDMGYEKGPIRLISCSTGTKEFAQNFANKMGVKVIAPSDTVWAHSDGKLTIGPKSYINNGKWIEFNPRKRGKG